MPLSYVIDPIERMVTITGEYADANELAHLLARLIADARRQPGFVFLRDVRDVTTATAPENVLEAFDTLRRLWTQLQPRRIALVATRRLDSAASMAHALAYAEQLPMRMFTSYGEALEWLRGGTDSTTRSHRAEIPD
jgi:hypothetical protein